jgi:hypothetical protein
MEILNTRWLQSRGVLSFVEEVSERLPFRSVVERRAERAAGCYNTLTRRATRLVSERIDAGLMKLV